MGLNATVGAPEAGAVLTHMSYSLHCSRVALERQEVAKVFVQCSTPSGTLCGLVKRCEDFDGREFFKVDTGVGERWVPCNRTRLCSGDGRCRCEDVL